VILATNSQIRSRKILDQLLVYLARWSGEWRGGGGVVCRAFESLNQGLRANQGSNGRRRLLTPPPPPPICICRYATAPGFLRLVRPYRHDITPAVSVDKTRAYLQALGLYVAPLPVLLRGRTGCDSCTCTQRPRCPRSPITSRLSYRRPPFRHYHHHIFVVRKWLGVCPADKDHATVKNAGFDRVRLHYTSSGSRNNWRLQATSLPLSTSSTGTELL
jgi:hypothetical protein